MDATTGRIKPDKDTAFVLVNGNSEATFPAPGSRRTNVRAGNTTPTATEVYSNTLAANRPAHE